MEITLSHGIEIHRLGQIVVVKFADKPPILPVEIAAKMMEAVNKFVETSSGPMKGDRAALRGIVRNLGKVGENLLQCWTTETEGCRDLEQD